MQHKSVLCSANPHPLSFALQGVAIQAVAFNEEASNLHNLLRVGKVYTFSGGMIKEAFNKTRTNHPWEIVFNKTTIIKEVLRTSAEQEGTENLCGSRSGEISIHCLVHINIDNSSNLRLMQLSFFCDCTLTV